MLVIIGIFSAIAIPALLGQREAACNRATASNASNVAAAIQVAIGIVEDQPLGSRSVLDLNGTTASMGAVLTAIAARTEYVSLSKNPFDSTQKAYTFGAAALVAGETGSVAPADATTGQNVVRISYGTNLKSVLQAINTLPKSPESSMAL